jgi:diadenosine tetraphosphate (Ap4A) HIT family hydrolase
LAGCYVCDLIARRDRGEAPPWDSIFRTTHWDVVHAYDTSLPGWLALVARRHLGHIAGLTEEEMIECSTLQLRASRALNPILGCEKTYVAAFGESVAHVHFHLIPRMPDMPADARGPYVFQRYLGVPVPERVSEARMNAIAESVRTSLLAMRE